MRKLTFIIIALFATSTAAHSMVDMLPGKYKCTGSRLSIIMNIKSKNSVQMNINRTGNMQASKVVPDSKRKKHWSLVFGTADKFLEFRINPGKDGLVKQMFAQSSPNGPTDRRLRCKMQ